MAAQPVAVAVGECCSGRREAEIEDQCAQSAELPGGRVGSQRRVRKLRARAAATASSLSRRFRGGFARVECTRASPTRGLDRHKIQRKCHWKSNSVPRRRRRWQSSSSTVAISARGKSAVAWACGIGSHTRRNEGSSCPSLFHYACFSKLARTCSSSTRLSCESP